MPRYLHGYPFSQTALTIFLTAVRQKSCRSMPRHPAFTQAALHALLKSRIRLPLCRPRRCGKRYGRYFPSPALGPSHAQAEPLGLISTQESIHHPSISVLCRPRVKANGPQLNVKLTPLYRQDFALTSAIGMGHSHSNLVVGLEMMANRFIFFALEKPLPRGTFLQFSDDLEPRILLFSCASRSILLKVANSRLVVAFGAPAPCRWITYAVILSGPIATMR